MTTIVKCPYCGKDVEWNEISLYRPFCSLRCKQIDLGAWADEEYKVPVSDEQESSEDDAAQV